MNEKKSYRGKIFVILALITVLVFAYFADGKKTPAPDVEKEEAKKIIQVPKETEIASYPDEAEKETDSKVQTDGEPTGREEKDKEEKKRDKENQEGKKQEEKEAQEQKKLPAEASEKEAREEEKNVLYCTLSVRCDTVFEDTSRVLPETLKILPENGVIFAERKAEFKEGESVFDVLLREMKGNGIHLEFVNTPIYGSVYIEGIGNLYEFDAGELSGWMYKVNGEFPNYGCSKYYLKMGAGKKYCKQKIKEGYRRMIS